ncbi:hypothetical protein HY065_01285 [Candidatus Berkelbacteria bacterium]|nr:hypothetical protein [Candidatus Berkelbacteria bacterium]
MHKLLATKLSLLFSPFTLFPLVAVVAIFRTPMPVQEQYGWIAAIILLNLMSSLIILGEMERYGIKLDDTLENLAVKRTRLIGFAPIMLILLTEIAMAGARGGYQPLFAVLTSSAVVALIIGIISFFWKISLHMVGASATITYLTLLLGPVALAGLPLIPALAWSRLVLKRHTPSQLFFGTVLPPLCIAAVFWYFRII